MSADDLEIEKNLERVDDGVRTLKEVSNSLMKLTLSRT